MAVYKKSKAWVFLIALVAICLVIANIIILTVERTTFIDAFAYTWVVGTPILVILVPRPYLIWRMASKVELNPSLKHMVLSAIPGVNVAYADGLLFEGVKFNKIVTAALYVMAAAIIILRLPFLASPLFFVVAYFLLYAFILLYYVQDVIFNWRMCTLLGRGRLRVMAVVFPPVCSYMLTGQLAQFFHQNKDVLEGTFDGESAAV